MHLKIQKWGNSLAIRLPKALLDMLGLSRESIVDVSLIEGKLVIEPIEKEKYSIEELIAEITPENCHEELMDGKARGREVW